MKLEAKDLRIGNLVYIGKEVNELELVDFVDMYENNTIKHFDPIPLTEEWLLNLGFEECRKSKQGVLKQYLKSKIKFDISNSGNVYLSHKNSPIFHAHQLQNLYYALTGEELTIKNQ